MRSDALVMHPGPMNRGVEISAEVADLPRAVILEQVRHGVAVRMAVLYLLLGAGVDRVLGPDGTASVDLTEVVDPDPTPRSGPGGPRPGADDPGQKSSVEAAR